MFIIFMFVISCFTTIGSVNHPTCNFDKCYQTVNNSHQNVLKLIKTLNFTSNSVKYPQISNLKQLANDIKDTTNVENMINIILTKWDVISNKIEFVHVKVSNNQNVATELLQKLSNISEYNKSAKNILDQTSNIQKKVENTLVKVEKEAKNCQNAYNKYAQFNKIIEEISKDHDNVTKRYNNLNKKLKMMNKKIKRGFEETMKTINHFDKLKLPSNLIENYFSKTEYTFNETINNLKRTADLLKELLDASYRNWVRHLKNNEKILLQYIKKIQDDVKTMSNDLSEYEKELGNTFSFQPAVNDNSKQIFEEIKKELEINLYKKIVAEIDDNRALLKIYKTVLDSIPINSKFKIVKTRVENLRTAVLLIQHWRYLQNQLVILRENRNEIQKINCSAVKVGGLIT